MTTNVARHLTVRGRVQGVFFRARTREQARRHGLTGWVANRADGSVEAWLEGPPDAVEAVERWIRDGGPPRAVVTEVEAAEDTPAGHDRFDVRH
ncbi:acylphosphatase [Egicoccus sp. AB-alg2]|uniref:acylphosphatase n=1 Tax=Egicoccus sp. AB-alg2 TaxID=3242693 RepID=UPI00359CC573